MSEAIVKQFWFTLLFWSTHPIMKNYYDRNRLPSTNWYLEKPWGWSQFFIKSSIDITTLSSIVIRLIGFTLLLTGFFPSHRAFIMLSGNMEGWFSNNKQDWNAHTHAYFSPYRVKMLHYTVLRIKRISKDFFPLSFLYTSSQLLCREKYKSGLQKINYSFVIYTQCII